MSFRNIIITAAIALFAAFAMADEFDYVIPAAGTGPGANGSQWQSEITVHNAGQEQLVVHLSYYSLDGLQRSFDLPIQGRATVTLPDVVKNDFGQTQSTGAIVLDTDDVLRGKLSISSRTFNLSPTGEFGQDIPALTATQSIAFGDTGILNGPANAAANRFNFGIFPSEATTVEWTLLRKDGTVAATVVKSYKAGYHAQYNAGVQTLFNVTPADNDVVDAQVRSGHAWIYGSIVNNASGDPTYVPGARTRENLAPEVLGISFGSGKVDIRDANQDNVLDQYIDIPTASFPTHMMLIAKDPEGKDLTFTLVTPDPTAHVDSMGGGITWSPDISSKGTVGKLIVRVSDGIDSVDFTINANIR
jgi:hypothetical protein